MGEMADLMIDQMIDWDCSVFGSSRKYSGTRTPPICRYCRKKKLHWKNVAGKWILFEKKKPHFCSKRPFSLETLKMLATATTGKKIGK